MANVNCPACRRSVDVEAEYRDWTVECPFCGHRFVPSNVSDVWDNPPPANAPVNDVADVEVLEYDERPRRKRRKRDYDREDREDLEDASIMVHNPGLSLEIVGWLSGLLFGVLCFFLVWYGLAVQKNPALANNDPPELILGVGIACGIIGLPYMLILIIGGRNLRSLGSETWAKTAAITATASILLICLVGICAIIPIGFGVWALTTLNNPLVRRGFVLNARERTSRYDARDTRDYDTDYR
jgi:hypothetical protein